MDMKLSRNPYKSYLLFQNRIVDQYKKMVDEFGLIKIDANKSIYEKQKFMRKKVAELLKDKNIFVEDHTASADRNEFKEDNLWVDVFCWDNVPMHFTKLRYAYFNSYIKHAWGSKRK